MYALKFFRHMVSTSCIRCTLHTTSNPLELKSIFGKLGRQGQDLLKKPEGALPRLFQFTAGLLNVGKQRARSRGQFEETQADPSQKALPAAAIQTFVLLCYFCFQQVPFLYAKSVLSIPSNLHTYLLVFSLDTKAKSLCGLCYFYDLILPKKVRNEKKITHYYCLYCILNPIICFLLLPSFDMCVQLDFYQKAPYSVCVRIRRGTKPFPYRLKYVLTGCVNYDSQ